MVYFERIFKCLIIRRGDPHSRIHTIPYTNIYFPVFSLAMLSARLRIYSVFIIVRFLQKNVHNESLTLLLLLTYISVTYHEFSLRICYL